MRITLASFDFLTVGVLNLTADGDVATGTATGTAGGSTTSPNAFTIALRAA